MAYTDEGKGDKTILFIHGLGHSHSAWSQNISYLSQYFRCIAIDLPGNGLSSAGDYPYGMNFFAESVAEFIAARQLQQVSVAGHSMGGQVAMTLALKYPDIMKGLVLCAPAGFEQFNDWEKNLYRSTMFFVDLISNEENSLRKTIQNSFYILPDNAQEVIRELIGQMRLQDRQQYRRMIEMCINGMLDEPVYHKLEEIKVPTLIVFGEKDSMIPNRFIHPVTTRQLAEAATAKFPDAILEMLPLCGHFLQWEKPVQLNGLIRHFLNSDE
jgi:pimeloyl-ACP methyl ester carboxylesterase